MQVTHDLHDALAIGTLIFVIFQTVIGDQVHHRVLALEQAQDAIHLILVVVDALEQGPLVLDRESGRAGIGLAEVDQFVGCDLRRSRQQGLTQRRIGAVQGQGQRRLDPLLRQALEHAHVADGGEHQILVADAAVRAEQVDGFEHVVEIVCGLAHAHEYHLLYRAEASGEGDLGNNLGTAQLTQQSALAGHAEHTANGAADLTGHAQAVARQQYAFHHLPIGQLHQQARRTVGRWMFGTQPRQSVDLGAQRRQPCAHAQRQEVLGLLLATADIERQTLEPGTGHSPDMTGLGADIGEALLQVWDSHRARILSGVTR